MFQAFVEQVGVVAEVDIDDHHHQPEVEDVGDKLAYHHLHTMYLLPFLSGLEKSKTRDGLELHVLMNKNLCDVSVTLGIMWKKKF